MKAMFCLFRSGPGERTAVEGSGHQAPRVRETLQQAELCPPGPEELPEVPLPFSALVFACTIAVLPSQAAATCCCSKGLSRDPRTARV